MGTLKEHNRCMWEIQIPESKILSIFDSAAGLLIDHTCN